MDWNTKLLLPLFFFISFTESTAQSDFLVKHIKNSSSLPASLLISEFPYDDYLKVVPYQNLKLLHTDRIYLEAHGLDAQAFFYRLSEIYERQNPVDRNNLNEYLRIGERFLTSHVRWPETNTDIYKTIGSYLLGKVALHLKDGIDENIYNRSSTEIAEIIRRLEQHKIYLQNRPNNFQKATKQLKDANFKYLFNRINLKLDEICYPIQCRTNINGRYFVYIAFTILVVLIFSRNNKVKWISSALLFSIGLSSFILPNCSQQFYSNKTYNEEQGIKLISSALNTKFSDRDGIHISEMEFQNQHLGHSILLQSSEFDVQYSAADSIYNSWISEVPENKIRVAATGGYSDLDKRPEGLMVESGNVQNALMVYDKHALACFHDSGHFDVLNLSQATISLPLIDSIIVNPLESLQGYSAIMNWARSEKFTIFQSHLLGYDDKLTITPSELNFKLRERRILAFCKDPLRNSEYLIIFNVTKPVELAKIARLIFENLKEQQFEIQWMINLDTGQYDILRVYDNDGKTLMDSPVDVSKAVNLLIFKKK